jgi:hypothetical protein
MEAYRCQRALRMLVFGVSDSYLYLGGAGGCSIDYEALTPY